MKQSVLDSFFAQRTIACETQPVEISPDELVHVTGTQEPVREQPDERARTLLDAGWLSAESIEVRLGENERAEVVTDLQQAARSWLKQAAKDGSAADREQVRWMLEKTRGHESKQQIVQRVWLATVLYNLGCRNLRFDGDGQILYDGGHVGRIGISPDAVIDIAWKQKEHQVYTASFRLPNGGVMRGKGRHRWYIYRLTIAPEAAFLFKHRAKQVHEAIALIVASDSHATQPQLPRNFYGGNEFQQACIDAQDGGFSHMLVLSPEHGIISLDDQVPSDQLWDYVLDHRVWLWQIMTVQRMGAYLFGSPERPLSFRSEAAWWAWLNPDSRYDVTVFGSGFAVNMLMEYLRRAKLRRPESWPEIALVEQRPGYDTGELDEDAYYRYDDDLDGEPPDDYGDDDMPDLELLLDWATELSELITLHVAPLQENWDLAPDETLIPVRLLAESDMDVDDLLELLTDMTLLLEQRLPISMVINSRMIVSVLLQITHSLVHDELDAVAELLRSFPEPVLHQYIEIVLQEPNREEQLCACLTLAEQMQLLSMAIPLDLADRLMVWFQTYLSTRMRHRLLDENEMPEA